MKVPKNVDAGLLLVRLGLGAIFLIHGALKWTNMDATVGFFLSTGLPASLAYAVATVELLAGVAVLVGFQTRVAASLLAVVMVGAIVTVKFALGFVGGWEYDALLLMASLGLATSGAGKYAIEKK
jgi:uncharacterized membrane protein YphA (DoxX/SURF4 family)